MLLSQWIKTPPPSVPDLHFETHDLNPSILKQLGSFESFNQVALVTVSFGGDARLLINASGFS